MSCGIMQCHVMWCHLMWSDAMQCDGMLCARDAVWLVVRSWYVIRNGCVIWWIGRWCAVNYGEPMSQYYDSVLQSTTPHYKVLQNTTRYYKVLLRTTKYYKVLLRTKYYSVLQSTTNSCWGGIIGPKKLLYWVWYWAGLLYFALLFLSFTFPFLSSPSLSSPLLSSPFLSSPLVGMIKIHEDLDSKMLSIRICIKKTGKNQRENIIFQKSTPKIASLYSLPLY